jgi:hypothetical protein
MTSPISIVGVLMLACFAEIPVTCAAQTTAPLSVKEKLVFHAKLAYGPGTLVGIAAIAGYQQLVKAPDEWGPGGAGYGRRIGYIGTLSGIRGVLGFGLDSALHEDPRYYRSKSTGFFPRVAHAIRGTILTRTDSGGETLSLWRIGGDYGAAFLSNTAYPDRLNTPHQGFIQGSEIMGVDLACNLGAEFWPDIRKKLFHR